MTPAVAMIAIAFVTILAIIIVMLVIFVIMPTLGVDAEKCKTLQYTRDWSTSCTLKYGWQ